MEMIVSNKKMPFRFIYKNAKGIVTRRSLVAITRESDEYFSGVQELDNAYRTFRKEQVQKVLYGISEWNKCEFPDPIVDTETKEHKQRGTSPYFNYDNKLEVAFTGFAADHRERLENLSRENGLFVRKSVTKNLNFLCTGYNAGRKKIEAALAMGVVLMDERAFMWLLETGEIPV